ncbi:MAG: anhydro-N-acetylmuramic acid kinase [Candidatus Zixiibacteriota bacterium]
MKFRLTPDSASLTILGMNSGTSADGLDMAVLTITRRKSAYSWRLRASQSLRFPSALRTRILDLALSDSTTLDELIAVDSALGHFMGHEAKKLIASLRRKGVRVNAVASHGQTVRHMPIAEKLSGFLSHGSLQIGSLDAISAATELPVVGNFRAADIALGYEGAPITVAPVHRLFALAKGSRLIVNIGGISNYFYFPAGKGVEASHGGDFGPGNSLSDILSQKLLKQPFDTDGQHASKGVVSQRLITLLLSQPFFRGKTTSTGREEFGSRLATRIMDFGKSHKLTSQDLLATAVELTAIAVARRLAPWVIRDSRCNSVLVTGGGRKNSYLVSRIREHCSPLSVEIIDDYGLDGDYVEAASYAVLGETFLRGMPSWTVGAGRSGKAWPVLGHLALPPEKRRR